MPPQDQHAIAPDEFSAAFEHSITWEDDVWRADPVDVEEVHAKARQRFFQMLAAVTAEGGGQPQAARIVLFHGQSGAGKTHLIRALRTQAHRATQAYFGYAQLTPDVQSYSDYFLRRLVNSLEKPYSPDLGGESGLGRLTRRLVEDCEAVQPAALDRLREANFDDAALARFILGLADDVIASPRFADEELDVNVIRALLYLQRGDPRIDQRIRQYLQGRQLTDLSHVAVGALEQSSGDGRAFEIVESLGKLMWAVDRAALVFCIDQVEDLRNFHDPEERFQKAVGNLMQIANRVPRALIIISCLEEFYGQARAVLPQSYVDRIEKSGPVALLEARTPEEVRLILAKRIAHQAEAKPGGMSYPDASAFFGPQFFEEFAGLSTRRLLEHAQNRLRSKTHDEPEEPEAKTGFISTLAAALGFGTDNDTGQDEDDYIVDYREFWERFASESEAEMPSSDEELMDSLCAALQLAQGEWGDGIALEVERLELADDLPAADIVVHHAKTNMTFEGRVFLCNRPTQGGGLKRQLDKVLGAMSGKVTFMLRASDFPPNKKNQTAMAFRKFRDNGGRSILVPIPEWERMLAIREFHAHHRFDPGFASWFQQAKLMSGLVSVIQLLRLDLLGRTLPRGTARPLGEAEIAPPEIAYTAYQPGHDVPGAVEENPPVAANDDELPIEVILDESGDYGSSIHAGRETGDRGRGRPVTLNMDVMKRHAAVLGGSGSGKTTLALSIIEQLLQRGIPAILIDRKGDLCSYANPDVWRGSEEEDADRRAGREKLGESIDVAVYTPGRSSGRPISITLLPTGISELPDHEQQLLANLSAAALGDMLHLKNSATHQKQSGTLSVALKILGSRSRSQVSLADLINLLEDEDPELTDATQRMDPSGRIRRDLVAQLDSLMHRNAALFDERGEPMSMERFLGLGRYARPGRTQLSIIYTGFLGDNENILFWVSQFLSEALRFCQRNPNEDLQAVVMFDEADLYIPANAKPATAEPLQSLLKRARSAGLGLMLATQSPGDLDYKSRDQITSWFIGRVREDTALRKLKAAFQSESGLDPTSVLPGQTVGEFHLVQEGLVRSMKAHRSLITAEQVPFDRIEQLAAETKGLDERQLKLFDKG
ncbi:MAG: hypothetical protein RLZ98_3250 [Pseudomonadota bacterium]|jgi:GTPase SAR1 family protein